MKTRNLVLAISAFLWTLPLQVSAQALPITDVLLDMSGGTAQVAADHWISAELRWSDLDGDYVAVRVMDDDPFQERLTWSDHYRDYVSVAMSKEAALRAYRAQLVWSDFHGDYLPRSELEPCPKTGLAQDSVRLAARF